MPTPTAGYKYSTPSATFESSGTLAASWTTAAGNWNSATHFTLTAGTNPHFTATDTYYDNVTWDGITYTTPTTTGIVAINQCFLNTFFTSQPHYTQDIINGIATHEFGHAIGLAHNNTNTASVMYPYTFQPGTTTPARVNVPGQDDIEAVNTLYATSTTSVSASSAYDYETICLHPSWAYQYEDIGQMYKHADIVVIGEITHNHEAIKIGKHLFHHYSPSTLKVEEVLKGDASLNDTEIILRQLGGEVNGVRVISDASTPLKKNHRFLLFLKKSHFGYYPINENEGIYKYCEPEPIFINLASGHTLGRHELLPPGMSR